MSFETATIASLAIANPGAIPTLERLGIDYCCGGARSVAEACAHAGVDPEALRALLEEAPRDGGSDWDGRPVSALIQHILDTHHVFTRRAIASLPPLAAKVRARHGDAHAGTKTVELLVQRLAEDLEPHLLKEEQILFPYILELEAAADAGGRPESCFGTVRNPIRMMMREHDAAGEILAELRTVTGSYVAPEDACTSFQALYAGLRELETDLHRHIHLENNVLFPRALALEEGRLSR